MRILKLRSETESASQSARSQGKKIGFVPTMGALHEGHLDLVRKARSENDLVFVSIFVNPEQFNNQEDFNLYPRIPDADIKLLESARCDYLFLPVKEEVFAGEINRNYKLGGLDNKLEGAFRPGHFQGVAAVVEAFFKIIQPHNAYFGIKDFQQLLVIKKLVELMESDINIVACETRRESDGLAMSSRNLRLSPAARKQAPQIYKALQIIKEAKDSSTPEELKSLFNKQLSPFGELRTEYVEIADAQSLEPLSSFRKEVNAVVCVAVYAGNIRLIDNISL